MTERSTIDTHQLQHLHALLRDHGITGDASVHDWIAVWLTEHEEDPVESRKDLPKVTAARMIHDLQTSEVQAAPGINTRGLSKLRAPFPDEAIGKLPRGTCRACREDRRKRCDQHAWISRCEECRGSHSSATIHIDYVGHADVTARLLEVDPAWSWEPMALDPSSGMPVMDRTGGLWIRLTVLGVTRPGYGDVTGTGGVKEAIGDALRNAAMRFGVALDLWAKGDREWAKAEKHDATTDHPDGPTPGQDTARDWRGPSTRVLLDGLAADAQRAGITMDEVTAKLRQDLTSDLDVDRPVTVADLAKVDPWVIEPFARSVRTYTDGLVAKRAAEAQAKAEQEAQAAAATTTTTTEEDPIESDGSAEDTPLPDPSDPEDPWATPGPGASGDQPA